MSFTIKDLKELLNDVTEQQEGITDETAVIFTHGDPTEGGAIFLAVSTGAATREDGNGEDVQDFFINIETTAEVFAVGNEHLEQELQS